MPGGPRLTRLMEAAIAALLTQPTVATAAEKAGVSERTLQLWLKRPEFASAYRDARRQVVEGAVVRLQQLTMRGVLALNRNLDCGNPSVEVRAAQVVFDLALRAVEVDDLLTRVEALEAAAEKKANERATQ